MNVLVTGASGFVGQALCHYLRAKSIKTIAALRDQAKSTLLPPVAIHHVGNIGAETDWRKPLAGCDSVIHLAARVHAPGNAAVDLASARSVNRDGTANLARQAADAGVRRFVFCSTVKVFGNGRNRPYTEADQPNPQDAYAISKLEAELALQDITSHSTMDFTIIRPPLVYGPGVGANFKKLLRLIESGLPLPFAAINNQRSLIYVGNLVDALTAVAQHPGAANQLFVTADAEPLSTPELIRLMANVANKPARLFNVPTSALNTAARLTRQTTRAESLIGSLSVDQSKIIREISWQPPHSTSEGLTQTSQWFTSRNGNPPLHPN